MGRYEYIVEVAKRNIYRDERGRFAPAPGGTSSKKRVSRKRKRAILDIDNLSEYDVSRLPSIKLSDKERFMLHSELNTHLSKEQRKQLVIRKTIGHYTYTFENFGYDSYRFVDKRLAKSIRAVQNGEDDHGR